jgi:hypothetical protein
LLLQSDATLQGCPLASFVPHLPLRQASPAAQSPTVVQPVRQEVGGLLH